MLSPTQADKSRSIVPTSAESGAHFDRNMIALYCAFFGGIGLDAWAHSHGQVDQSFFTPWHAVMYGSFLLLVIFVGRTVVANYLPGKPIWYALPVGYGGLLVGVGIFFAAGVGDLLWHTAFGIEKDIEAVFSPTHLLLATGAALILGAPFRAAWLRAKDGTALTFLDSLPTFVSMSFMLSLLGVLVFYIHPLANFDAVANAQTYGANGIALFASGVVIHTALVMGTVLFAVRRWMLPFGAFTLILTLNAAFLCIVLDTLWALPFYFVAGLVTDVLAIALKPSTQRVGAFRWFAFIIPCVINGFLFAAIATQTPIGWSIHVWTGTIFIAGFVGLLASYLVMPPLDVQR